MMKKFLQKRLKNEKGLTLVELLAVIVILGIIAAIAVPSIGNIIENSRYNAAKADAINVLNAANMYFLENPDATTVEVGPGEGTLVGDGYLESQGKVPNDGEVTKGSPNKLEATVEYSKGKSVEINASADEINNDSQKGSGEPSAIPGGGTTTNP